MKTGAASIFPELVQPGLSGKQLAFAIQNRRNCEPTRQPKKPSCCILLPPEACCSYTLHQLQHAVQPVALLDRSHAPEAVLTHIPAHLQVEPSTILLLVEGGGLRYQPLRV